MDAINTARYREGNADFDNGLVAHFLECHRGAESVVKFKMDIAESFNRPMQRQIAEGVAIHHSKDTVIMNGISPPHLE